MRGHSNNHSHHQQVGVRELLNLGGLRCAAGCCSEHHPQPAASRPHRDGTASTDWELLRRATSVWHVRAEFWLWSVLSFLLLALGILAAVTAFCPTTTITSGLSIVGTLLGLTSRCRKAAAPKPVTSPAPVPEVKDNEVQSQPNADTAASDDRTGPRGTELAVSHNQDAGVHILTAFPGLA